jgi:translation initiation factor IF-1
MAKESQIEAHGLIVKESGNGFFKVELDEPKGHECLCRAAGRLVKHKIHLLVGDRVTVALSPYDLERGRITLREK